VSRYIGQSLPFPFTLNHLPLTLIFFYHFTLTLKVTNESGCNVVLNDKKYFIPVFYTNTFISDYCYNDKKILSSGVLGR